MSHEPQCVPTGGLTAEEGAASGSPTSQPAFVQVGRTLEQNGNQSRLYVFVLIDALGWKFVESIKFLDELLPYRKPLRTVLGFSSGAIPTMLTGVLPAQHGHWNLYYYDPKGSPFRWLRRLDFLPQAILDNRIGRKLLKELGRHLLGLGPMFECLVRPRLLPYFNWVEKRNIYSAKGISGHRSIFDQLEAAEISYRVYSYHSQHDDQILDSARQDIEQGAARFFFIYLSEIDHFLHEHCSDTQAISEKLSVYAAKLSDIYRSAASSDGKLTFTVISDHGMTKVHDHYDIYAEIGSLPLAMPEDYLAVYDSTMARFWFFNDRARQLICNSLARIRCGHVLQSGELRDLGIYFPDHRFGDLVFLLDPGWLFSRSDFHGRWMPSGMHGYHPDDPWSDAVFLSNQEPPVVMSSIRDIYDCLKECLPEGQA